MYRYITLNIKAGALTWEDFTITSLNNEFNNLSVIINDLATCVIKSIELSVR